MLSVNDQYARSLLSMEPLLRKYLRRFTWQRSDVDDLLQETYVRLLALGDMERRRVKNTEAFAVRIARNIAFDWARRRRLIITVALESLDAHESNQEWPAVEELVNLHQELQDVSRSIASLGDRCAQVFTLRRIYGLTQREIAAVLGISVSTVEQHLVIAVKRCRQRRLSAV